MKANPTTQLLRKLSVLIILLLIVPKPRLAHAVTSTAPATLDPSRVQAAPPEAPGCNDICSKMVKVSGQGEHVFLGVDGSDSPGWTAAIDDAWCGKNGQETDHENYPNALNFIASAAQLKDGGYKAKIERCQLRNSQLGVNCRAWAASTNGAADDAAMAVIDLAAGAICAVQCAEDMTVAGGIAAQTVANKCKIAGVFAGAAEVLDTVAMSVKSGVTSGKIAGGTAGAVGGIAALVGSKASVGTLEKASGCAAAAIFGGTALIRSYALYGQYKSKENSCQAIQKLWSDATSSNANSNGISSSSTSFLAGGNGNGYASGARNGGYSSSTGNSGLTPQLSTALDHAMAATDGGLLYHTPLGAAALAHANSLDPQALMKSIGSGQLSPGQALSGAIGSAAPELASIVSTSDKAIKDFMNNHDTPGTSYAGSSGAGGGRTETNAGFMGFEKNPTIFSNSKEMDFKGNRSLASDIWHTGTTLNLFQIVSGKIEKVSSPLVK